MYDDWIFHDCKYPGCDEELGFAWLGTPPKTDPHYREDLEFQCDTIRREGWDVIETRYFTVLCPEHKNRKWKIRKESHDIMPHHCWVLYEWVDWGVYKGYTYISRYSSINEALAEIKRPEDAKTSRNADEVSSNIS